MERDKRNPYLTDDDKPVLKSSVVAFVDILGYKSSTDNAHKEGKSQAFLNKLHQALLSGYQRLDECDENGEKIIPVDSEPLNRIFKKDIYKMSAFTDNIVIGYPIHKDAENELESIFSALAYFQLEMVNQGFFIRGAISIGDIYMDELTVFGHGLLESYNAETKDAINPRIILTKSAQDKVKDNIEKLHTDEDADGRKAFNPKKSSHWQDLYKDKDGRFFLNYLDTIRIGEDNEYFIALLEDHKRIMEEKLQEHRDDSFFPKYVWSANYHNYFCDQFSEFVEHKIDLSLFETYQFSRIYEYPNQE
jgi:hypothetical protein